MMRTVDSDEAPMPHLRRYARRFGCVLLAVALTVATAWAAGAQRLPTGSVADRLVVEKAARVLSVYRGNRLLKTYRIALGPNPVGRKEQEGDGRTPEGSYVIDFKKRDSAFHRALHISYPNAEDRRRARQRGVSPGGAIMIHGLPNGVGIIDKAHAWHDWTAGCIAVSNSEIEELWNVVPVGTRIDIRP
jgi:murein L,D-transpeptidase YafK